MPASRRVLASQEQASACSVPPTICDLTLAAFLLDVSEAEVIALLDAGEIVGNHNHNHSHGLWEIDLASLRGYAQRQRLV